MTQSETLRAYYGADSPDQWLTDELERFFDVHPDHVSTTLLTVSRESARCSADAFLGREVDPKTILATTLVFFRPGAGVDGSSGGIFTGTLDPLALLELAVVRCEPLDMVVVSHLFASGAEVTHQHTWPFGLSEAVDLLTPASVLELDS